MAWTNNREMFSVCGQDAIDFQTFGNGYSRSINKANVHIGVAFE